MPPSSRATDRAFWVRAAQWRHSHSEGEPRPLSISTAVKFIGAGAALVACAGDRRSLLERTGPPDCPPASSKQPTAIAILGWGVDRSLPARRAGAWQSLDTRRDQMFPDAGRQRRDRGRSRFASGPAQDFAPGAVIFEIDAAPGVVHLVLKALEVSRRDGIGPSIPASWWNGRASSRARLSQLSGRGSLAEGHAGRAEAALAFRCGAHARAHRRLSRARQDRDALSSCAASPCSNTGTSGSVLVGRPEYAGLLAAAKLPAPQLAYPTTLDADDDADGCRDRALRHPAGRVAAAGLPQWQMLKRPSDAEVGLCLGITPELDPE